MLFNSYEFIFLFLPITFLGFFLLGKYGGEKTAILWLVLVSLFFYGWWDFRYVPLLFGSICFNYLVGKKIEKHSGRKPWLLVGIVINVALLGYFKYTGFFLNTVNTLAGVDWFDVSHIVLPLGISFFTFTQTAYLIDIYRGETKNHSFLTYCEFVTIFPHLIAGPIINHRNMIPQFTDTKNFLLDYRNIAMGISLFTMGLFKKVVIADALSPWVGKVFARTDSLTFIEAWIGALGYTFQLYFDFSGYSEMAIGLGLMFNLKFPQNFNSPYQATSVIDFWRRWHMTLGLWVKDYLYIPMGGNQHGEIKKMYNLFASMLIIGLWHGAGWTFVFWGGLHGIFLMVNHQWRRLKINLPQPANWFLTFMCAVIAWVFFRAENFHDAVAILLAMADWGNIASKSMENLTRPAELIGVLMIVLITCPNPQKMMAGFHTNKKWLVAMVILGIWTLCSFSQVSDFLYFQF